MCAGVGAGTIAHRFWAGQGLACGHCFGGPGRDVCHRLNGHWPAALLSLSGRSRSSVDWKQLNNPIVERAAAAGSREFALFLVSCNCKSGGAVNKSEAAAGVKTGAGRRSRPTKHKLGNRLRLGDERGAGQLHHPSVAAGALRTGTRWANAPRERKSNRQPLVTGCHYRVAAAVQNKTETRILVGPDSKTGGRFKLNFRMLLVVKL